MDFLYNYVSQIAIFVVFTAFIEIILPDGKYRKYINIIVGFILVIIMIKPIEKVFNENFSIDLFVFDEDINLSRKIIEKEEKKYTEKQRISIANNFCLEIEKHITSLISNMCIVNDIEVNIDEDFQIQNIYIIVSYKEKEKPFIRIEKNNNIEKENLINNIKKIVSDFYSLDENNINITIQKN